MINTAAIFSLRSLPLLSPYGLGMIFFYLVAACAFFIPTALVSAEMASLLPEEGGILAWLRAAFGDRIAFLGVWLSLITTVTALTMTLVFIAASTAYAISPALAGNKLFSCAVVIALVWGGTAISLGGMRVSAAFTSLATLLGTIIPGALIVALGLRWLSAGCPIAMSLDPHTLLPKFHDFSSFSFLSGVLFAFAGMEMSAFHIKDVANPGRTYPRAIFYSALLILGLSALGSMSIAVAVPREEIRLEAGVIQALTVMLRQVGLGWLAPAMGLLIAFGGTAYAFAWLAGPTRGLLATRITGDLPLFLQKTNRHGMPSTILLFQAAIVTVCALLFLLVPSVSLGFWILNAVSAVLVLIMYVFLFLAAPALRVKMPRAKRSYRIPFGFLGISLTTAVGLASVIFCTVIAFVLPTELSNELSPGTFALTVLLVTATLSSPPFLFHIFRRPSWKND
jgi:amino acid transporter